MDDNYEDRFTIVPFSTLDDTVKDLIRSAVEVSKQAYCPYSHFAVGSALLTEQNKIYTGCNIENAAFSPSICAERAAISKALSEGDRNIKMVAVSAQTREFTAPCGVCRQTLSEFRGYSGDIQVFLAKPSMDQVLCTSISELLPLSFNSFKPNVNVNGSSCDINST